jgi:hypothetical protein
VYLAFNAASLFSTARIAVKAAAPVAVFRPAVLADPCLKACFQPRNVGRHAFLDYGDVSRKVIVWFVHDRP